MKNAEEEACSGKRKEALYETVAQRIIHLIDHGTYGVGDRIPSIRGLSRQMQVSLTTVMEAYRLLEDLGVIEAHPQSGFYVRARHLEPPHVPAKSEAIGDPIPVRMGDLVMRVMRDTLNPDLVQFSAALPNPDLLPTEKLTRLLAAVTRREQHRSDVYEIPPGCEELRVQVARRSLEAGCRLTPSDIIVTCGCQEAVVLSLRAVCKAGDIVAVESPTYFNFLQAIELLGLRALEIPTHPEEGMRLDALQQAVERHPVRACLLSTNFSNPLGATMPESKRAELVTLLARSDIPLIEDDVYGDLSFAGLRPRLAKSFDTKGMVLLCSSFSKTLAPGYRVGWIAPGRFQAQIEHLKFVSNIAAASPPAIAIAEFLANGGYDHHLRRVRRVYSAQMGLMSQHIYRFFPEGTRVSRPSGGYVLWVQCPEHVDAVSLYQRALRRGITLAPGPLFSPQQGYRNCIRLNSAQWSPKAAEAIAGLGQLITAA